MQVREDIKWAIDAALQTYPMAYFRNDVTFEIADDEEAYLVPDKKLIHIGTRVVDRISREVLRELSRQFDIADPERALSDVRKLVAQVLIAHEMAHYIYDAIGFAKSLEQYWKSRGVVSPNVEEKVLQDIAMKIANIFQDVLCNEFGALTVFLRNAFVVFSGLLSREDEVKVVAVQSAIMKYVQKAMTVVTFKSLPVFLERYVAEAGVVGINIDIDIDEVVRNIPKLEEKRFNPSALNASLLRLAQRAVKRIDQKRSGRANVRTGPNDVREGGESQSASGEPAESEEATAGSSEKGSDEKRGDETEGSAEKYAPRNHARGNPLKDLADSLREKGRLRSKGVSRGDSESRLLDLLDAAGGLKLDDWVLENVSEVVSESYDVTFTRPTPREIALKFFASAAEMPQIYRSKLMAYRKVPENPTAIIVVDVSGSMGNLSELLVRSFIEAVYSLNIRGVIIAFSDSAAMLEVDPEEADLDAALKNASEIRNVGGGTYLMSAVRLLSDYLKEREGEISNVVVIIASDFFLSSDDARESAESVARLAEGFESFTVSLLEVDEERNEFTDMLVRELGWENVRISKLLSDGTVKTY